MSTNDPRREDGGYGAANLVGSNESGLRSAIEGRQALEAARERDATGEQHPRPVGRDTRASGDDGRARRPSTERPSLNQSVRKDAAAPAAGTADPRER